MQVAKPDVSTTSNIPTPSTQEEPIAPPPQAAPKPVQETVSAEPAKEKTTQATTKIGLGMLQKLKEKNTAQSENILQEKDLTPALLEQIIQNFHEHLANNGKELIRNQMMEAKYQMENPDLILITCNKHLQFNTAQAIRQDLTDFVISKTNRQQLKINIELNEELEDETIVLSKHELFEEMANALPILHELKKEFGLSIVGKYQYSPPPPEVEVAPVEQEAFSLEEEPSNEEDEAE